MGTQSAPDDRRSGSRRVMAGRRTKRLLRRANVTLERLDDGLGREWVRGERLPLSEFGARVWLGFGGAI